MKANKVVLNGELLIDLSQDTAVESDVAVGKTFHKADGSLAVGTHQCSGGSGGITPSGTLTITANGEYNVTYYATAKVELPLYWGEYADL